jgi:hypothetical protein
MGAPKVSDADEAAIRAAVSEGFRAYTEDGINRHVSYKLGAKDGETEIDCAGFIEKSVRRVFDDYLTNGDKLVLNRKGQNHVFDCGADDQISEVSRKTGVLLQGDKVNLKSLKEGMIVGIDYGPQDWAKGRDLWNDISHIVLIYRDPKTNELMVGQSSGSGHGVNAKPLKEWYDKVHASGAKLYATDVVKLAENIGAKPIATKPTYEAWQPASVDPAAAAVNFTDAFPNAAGDFGVAARRSQPSTPAPALGKLPVSAPKAGH